MVMMCLAHFPLFWSIILTLLFCPWLLIVLLLINYEVLVHHIMILRWIIYDFYFYHVSRHILFLSLFLTSHDWLIMVYTTSYKSELSLTIYCFTCLNKFYLPYYLSGSTSSSRISFVYTIFILVLLLLHVWIVLT
jgi:hypothetical protein